MSALTYQSRPELRTPVLIAAFEGWSDAGDAATSAIRYLHGQWDSAPLATIDSEDFFDFQAHRPHVRLNPEGIREITWPETEFTYAKIAAARCDAVLLRGVEPSMRWRTFTAHIMDVARETGAEMVIGLGALYAGRPHTRPVRVTGAATTPELAERYGLQQPRYEGPTGILGILADACRHAEIPAVTFWSWVPHYLQGSPSPTAALALLQRLRALLELDIDLSELESRSRAHEARIAEAVRLDPEVAATVEELERQSDAEEPEELPSGEELAEEVERFLRNQGGDT
jgi:proteasome assembly chaperone (PAC2) family protein